MTLDWMIYVLGIIIVIFLIAIFFKYKKYNQYADKFEDAYPEAKQFYENETEKKEDEDVFIPLIPVKVSEEEIIQNYKIKRDEDLLNTTQKEIY